MTKTKDRSGMDRAALAAEYVERIGYDPFEDDPTISEDAARRVLAEYDEEIATSEAVSQ